MHAQIPSRPPKGSSTCALARVVSSWNFASHDDGANIGPAQVTRVNDTRESGNLILEAVMAANVVECTSRRRRDIPRPRHGVRTVTHDT